MPNGIIIFGANGSGKSTVGRELALALNFKHMDIEDYHFIKSAIPYTAERSREDCVNLMLADIEQYPSFVLSAVTGNLGEKITSMYRLAVQISTPLEARMERIKHREYERHGERIHEGGDMYDQNLKFIDFVASRSLSNLSNWAETPVCPIIQIDGTKPVLENVHYIVQQYRVMMEYLDLLESKIALYDGMLIETGGSFGRGKLGGDDYINKCLEIARKHLARGGSRQGILDMIDRYIAQYEPETDWKYYPLEMAFLKSLKEEISEIK